MYGAEGTPPRSTHDFTLDGPTIRSSRRSITGRFWLAMLRLRWVELVLSPCGDLDIEIIDRAVNVDHVHLFIKYPPKCSVSCIAKRIQRRSSRELRKAFPHLMGWCEHWSLDRILYSWLRSGHIWDVVEDTYKI